MAEDETGTADLRARIEELEETVEELRSLVEDHHRTVAYLAADADLEALDPTCPSCGSDVTVKSGLSWQRFECPDCGLEEYL